MQRSRSIPQKPLYGIRLLLIVICGLAVSGCKKPKDRVGPPLTPDKEKESALLHDLNAQPVVGVDGMHFKSTTGDLKDCRKCHTEKGLINPDGIPDTGRKAHWDIDLDHNDKVTCKSCHDATLPDMLSTGKELVPIEQSHRLCGACHVKQFTDWKGGAHGKRLSGWARSRVVATCVECHDPHMPEFKADPTVAPPKIIPDRLKGGKNDVH